MSRQPSIHRQARHSSAPKAAPEASSTARHRRKPNHGNRTGCSEKVASARVSNAELHRKLAEYERNIASLRANCAEYEDLYRGDEKGELATLKSGLAIALQAALGGKDFAYLPQVYEQQRLDVQAKWARQPTAKLAYMKDKAALERVTSKYETLKNRLEAQRSSYTLHYPIPPNSPQRRPSVISTNHEAGLPSRKARIVTNNTKSPRPRNANNRSAAPPASSSSTVIRGLRIFRGRSRKVDIGLRWLQNLRKR